MFDGMKPGSHFIVRGMSKNSALQIFEVWKTDCGIKDSDFQIVMWSDPADTPDHETARRLHILRCDGMNDAEIAKIRNRDKPVFNDEWFCAPLRDGVVARPRKRLTPSVHRWEEMAVGDMRLIHTGSRDVRAFLNQAMAIRRLDWEFKVTRQRQLESGPTPVWKVERIK